MPRRSCSREKRRWRAMWRNRAAILSCGPRSGTIPASPAATRRGNGFFSIPASGWPILPGNWEHKPVPKRARTFAGNSFALLVAAGRSMP